MGKQVEKKLVEKRRKNHKNLEKLVKIKENNSEKGAKSYLKLQKLKKGQTDRKNQLKIKEKVETNGVKNEGKIPKRNFIRHPRFFSGNFKFSSFFLAFFQIEIFFTSLKIFFPLV